MGLVVEQEMRETDSPGLPPCVTCTAPALHRHHVVTSGTSSIGASYHHGLVISDTSGSRKRQGLIEVTLRTVALIRRNQLLQARLSALQAETRAFVQAAVAGDPNVSGGDSS